MANWWESAPTVSPVDAAIQMEGLDPQKAAIAKSIYQQESSSGANTATSNAGAVGGMQIIPMTFQRMADPGWDINDPLQNARAGVRYVSKLYDLAGGDPKLTAAGYYGGEGAIPKAKAGIAVSDPRNPNAPNTLQYADQVAARIAPATSQGNWWESAPVVEANQSNTEPPKPDVSDSSLVAIGAGLGKGVGTVALNAQNYLGKGMSAVGLETPGNWLQQDATQGLKNLEGQVAPYKEVSPFSTGAGELAGSIAATWPVGGILGKALGAAAPLLGKVAPTAHKLAEALRTSGMSLGGVPATSALGTAGNLALRALGGAGTGYASAGLVNPAEANTGAVVGAAVPVVAAGAIKGAQMLGNALRGGAISQPVANLATRAQQLGIDIPADRIANSKPLNAVASSLNYVPFSGRAAVEEGMQTQMNRALTKTFGQNSDNVTQALRQAETALGGQFDNVLQSATVKVDNQFLSDLAQASQQAISELPAPQAKIINNQIDEIINQAAKGSGALDGQLAYNIKKTLDRIGARNSPEGWYANELRKKLMDALNRSLSPQAAQDFSTLRQQYGNMLSLRQLAQNGADGDISIAKLANMKNIRNSQLQELADIAAQFLKPRESQHSAMQRVLIGGVAGATSPQALLAGALMGRGANMALNSNTARNMMLGQSSNTALANALRNVLPVSSKIAPVIAAQ